MKVEWRKTSQYLAPAQPNNKPEDGYVLYPGFPVGSGQIELGWVSLAEKLAQYSQVVIDGYVGVFWENLRSRLEQAFLDLGIRRCSDQH
jgi:hypothetical protein